MTALYPIHPLPCGVLSRVTYRCAMFRRFAAALAAAVSLAAPAAAAAAPVLDPLKPCYVAARVDPATGYYVTEDVKLKGSGFTPGARVNVTVDGVTAAADVPIGDTGLLDVVVKAPYQDKGERPFGVTVTEQQDAAQTVSAESIVTRLMVKAKPRKARPSQRILLTGRGFTLPNRAIFAHYVRKGRVKRTVRLARRPTGPCGVFGVRRKQFPFKPRTGNWVVQVDQQRRYESPPSTAFVALRILVRRELLTSRPKSG